MNYLIANSVCCCLQCCCKQLFQTLYKIMGKTSFIKTMYFIVYAAFITILLTAFIFLRDWPLFMSYVARGIHCNSADDFDCITVSLIYRMVTSISIFIMFLLIIMSLCSVRVSHILNQGLFFSKLVIITVIFIILLQFDNSIYEHLSTAFKWISYLFIICQGIIIIDLGYLWGIKWAQKYSAGEDCKYTWLLIIFTIFIFLLALGFNIYGYVLVADQNNSLNSLGLISECSYLPNILGSIFILLSIGIQLLNFNKQNSLLTTSFMCIYMSFWCFSAIYSSNKCNLNSFDKQSKNSYQKSDFYLFGTIASLFWLLLSTFGSIYGSTNKIGNYEESENNQIEYIELQDNNRQKSKNSIQKRQAELKIQSKNYSGENKRNWVIWHFFMLSMVIYLSMILTDWGSGNLITQQYNLNENGYWSKLVMGSLCFIFYIWTLVAPRIFPDRNFYFV